MMPRGPQNYKIRRLVKKDGKEVYEWYTVGASPNPYWQPLQLDGYLYTDFKQANTLCERMKVKNRDPNVIYHSVVPIG